MGNARKVTIAAVLCGLVLSAAAAGTAAGATAAGSAAAGSAAAGGPTTTRQCENKVHIACYTPAQIRQAYHLYPLYAEGITGKGTTIVIVESFGSPTIKHDLAVFDAAFGIPAPPSFKVIAPIGKIPAFNPKNSTMTGWAAETTQDVEWSHAIAPGARLLLVESPVNESEGVAGYPQIVRAEEYVLRHYHVDVISQSFDATEQTFPSRASVTALRGAILAARKDGVTVLAAAGDNGPVNPEPDLTTNYLFPTTTWEPSDPLVTGVGGTALHLDAAGNHTSPDSVWNDTYNRAASEFFCGTPDNCPFAGGGGTSVFFSRPWYQNGVARVVGNHRGTPDIAMSAACSAQEDVYSSFPAATPAFPSITAGSPWGLACGTSEATPLFAGIVSLAAQFAGHSLGLINPALYQMSAARDPGIIPVTRGNTTVTFEQNGKWYTIRGFRGAVGYSLAAGVGTINARYFVPELAALAGRR
jgi:subtilase family serine protease